MILRIDSCIKICRVCHVWSLSQSYKNGFLIDINDGLLIRFCV